MINKECEHDNQRAGAGRSGDMKLSRRLLLGTAPATGWDQPEGIGRVPARLPRVVRLSVLDLIPVRTGQTTSQALQASVALARTAEAAGYHRYWVAEHHNMPAVASTNPPVLIALLASATERIRVGSGGVMLPNHAPLVVAEQFSLLESAFPSRIDLGIGRAPGSDPVTNWALRHGGGGTEGIVEEFPTHVANLIMMMSPEGVGLALQDRTYDLHATPKATSIPTLWLLGSSDYSARLAAEQGLPYVFAHHFAGEGTAQMLQLYRDNFKPSELLDAPRTFLTANASVAETTEEAERLALPQLVQMAGLRTGRPLSPQLTVEAAETDDYLRTQALLIEQMRGKWVIGDPGIAAKKLIALAEEFGVDEVMVNPVAGAYEDTPADAAPAREQTLRLLAEAVD
ncbi:alkanal monooxygenase subunit alpha [Microlunatus endophyticus]|uniref:Alkanal monooxygenase subunit alpha n=1 Tax=Microlunatus endophyticus TaxID=1716077 RepID=A0A917S044_9ACTN|nr:alkanal monooxygenase subunit alpha [Microlunatus endophyticus]